MGINRQGSDSPAFVLQAVGKHLRRLISPHITSPRPEWRWSPSTGKHTPRWSKLDRCPSGRTPWSLSNTKRRCETTQSDRYYSAGMVTLRETGERWKGLSAQKTSGFQFADQSVHPWETDSFINAPSPSPSNFKPRPPSSILTRRKIQHFLPPPSCQTHPCFKPTHQVKALFRLNPRREPVTVVEERWIRFHPPLFRPRYEVGWIPDGRLSSVSVELNADLLRCIVKDFFCEPRL